MFETLEMSLMFGRTDLFLMGGGRGGLFFRAGLLGIWVSGHLGSWVISDLS